MEVARKGLLPDIGMGRTGGGCVGGVAEVLAGLGVCKRSGDKEVYVGQAVLFLSGIPSKNSPQDGTTGSWTPTALGGNLLTLFR